MFKRTDSRQMSGQTDAPTDRKPTNIVKLENNLQQKNGKDRQMDRVEMTSGWPDISTDIRICKKRLQIVLLDQLTRFTLYYRQKVGRSNGRKIKKEDCNIRH